MIEKNIIKLLKVVLLNKEEIMKKDISKDKVLQENDVIEKESNKQKKNKEPMKKEKKTSKKESSKIDKKDHKENNEAIENSKEENENTKKQSENVKQNDEIEKIEADISTEKDNNINQISDNIVVNEPKRIKIPLIGLIIFLIIIISCIITAAIYFLPLNK